MNQLYSTSKSQMMEKEYGNIDSYRLCSEIGTGASCQVFVGFKSENPKQKVAIKIINEDSKFSRDEDIKMMAMELMVLSKVQHKHIVKVHSGKDNGKLKIGNLEFKEPYTVMELAENGCFVDYLIKTGFMSENLSRHYFRQLIDGLEQLHSQGYIHRDIKPDNLLLNSDFDLLISDFGHCIPMIDGVSEDGTYWSQLGTPLYNPPESEDMPPRGTAAVDLFMAGSVLFVFLTGRLPFEVGALRDDKFYKYFYQGNPSKFWTEHMKGLRHQPSHEVIDLLNRLFSVDPTKRPSLNEIKSHNWYIGELPSKEMVTKDMQIRVERMLKDSRSPTRR